MDTSQNKPERVGRPYDPVRLKSILAAHVVAGGTLLEGNEAIRFLQLQRANGVYWPREGGPGTLILYPDATRIEIEEEFLHVEQYRVRGWPTSDPQVNPLLRVEIEVEAQSELLRIAKAQSWTEAEVAVIMRNKQVWDAKLQQLKGRQ